MKNKYITIQPLDLLAFFGRIIGVDYWKHYILPKGRGVRIIDKRRVIYELA